MRKTTPGQPNPGYLHYSEDKTSYKVVALTYPWCSGRTLNSNVSPNMNASQPSLLPEGSSMESFTLGPTPKIDFKSAQQWLQRDKLSTITLQFNSLSTKEFNTEFLQFSSLGTSIYRLQVQMSLWHDKT
jgi:hypothetical protein